MSVEKETIKNEEVIGDAVPVKYREDKEARQTPPRIARFEKVSFETFL